MNLEGLTEKRRGKTSLWYENNAGEIIAKQCNKCTKVKAIDTFSSGKRGLGGRRSRCKQCEAEYRRGWEETHRESEIERKRKWSCDNYEYVLEKNRRWNKENSEKRAIVKLRRRARKSALPDTLTEVQRSEALNYFNGCAITGASEFHWDHVIPLDVGHGGTIHGNMIPLRPDLNISKHNRNIFEWFEANRQRFNLEQERFDRLIEWLGKANGMTVEEYRDYVYECHANPNAIDDADEAI